MNLAENLDRTARARGRFAAVALEDAVTSFDEVDRWSRHVAGFLALHGVDAGDRVALALPDVPEFAAFYYGILRLGAVVVPMSPALTEQGLHQRLRDAGACGVVAWGPDAEAVDRAAESLGLEVWALQPGRLSELLGDALPWAGIEPRSADDTAVIAFTAGTTGDPRGARLTHGNLARNCEAVVNDLLQLTSDDVVLAGLPLFHSFTQTAGLNAAVRAGACLVLLAHVDGGAALRTLGERGVTVLHGGPETFAALLGHPPRDGGLPRLRLGVSGGAAMPVDVLLGFEEAFGCRVLEGYGLAETSPVASFNRFDRRRVGSIGTPTKGTELRVVDGTGAEVTTGEPGEIVVRGHNVMAGYEGRPEATAATLVDGWLHTGDVGFQDEDGFFYVVDRLTDLIVRDGRTVFPHEVEDVLREHAAVAEAAVIGVPHADRGAEVHALVTLRPGTAATSGELRSFVAERVPSYMNPRVVDVVAALPTTSTGAVLKRAIRLETRA